MGSHTVGRVGLFIVLSVAATLIPVAPAFSQSPTFARTNYPFLGNDHTVGDFNADGRIDLAGIGLQTAVIMLGNGDGTFAARVEFPATSTGQAQAVAAGDFNRDGALDLIVTINDPTVGVALLTGRGDGTFNTAVTFPNTSGFDSPALAAVDVNNDLNLDAVIGHEIACYTAPCRAGRSITVLLGNGNGTFQAAREIDVGSGTAAISAGDFNRDGVTDLALASSSSRVHILLGAGDGTFAQQTLTFVAENNTGMDNTDIDVADLNGDAVDDLVVAMSLNGSKTVILIGNGNGTFRVPVFIQEPDLRVPQYQAVADYNGDGRPDLALSLAFGSQGLMEIRSGNGDGTFGPLVLYLMPPPLSSIGGLKIVAADFDADGKPDLALGWGGASSGLAALRNTTGTTPPATPAAPTLVSPANGATSAQPVTLDWNDVTNAAGYDVQVDNSSTIAAPFVANPTVTVSQVTLSGLPAQQLWWRVRAKNSAGVFGPFSATQRFTVQSSGQTATLTVTATGRSGERVTSNPAGINVAVGSTGAASFNTGTSITLSVSNGREAIWSGACSSGGNRRRTCTFTLAASASVTANVR